MQFSVDGEPAKRSGGHRSNSNGDTPAANSAEKARVATQRSNIRGIASAFEPGQPRVLITISGEVHVWVVTATGHCGNILPPATVFSSRLCQTPACPICHISPGKLRTSYAVKEDASMSNVLPWAPNKARESIRPLRSLSRQNKHMSSE